MSYADARKDGTVHSTQKVLKIFRRGYHADLAIRLREEENKGFTLSVACYDHADSLELKKLGFKGVPGWMSINLFRHHAPDNPKFKAIEAFLDKRAERINALPKRDVDSVRALANADELAANSKVKKAGNDLADNFLNNIKGLSADKKTGLSGNHGPIKVDRDVTLGVYILSFPYNKKLVELVRSLPARKYIQETKQWQVPISEHQELQQFLAKCSQTQPKTKKGSKNKKRRSKKTG